MFMIKVTAQFQNFIESLSILHFLHYWTLCHQFRCVHELLVLLITKPTTKSGYNNTDNTLRFKVSLGIQQGGGGGILPCKVTDLVSCGSWLLSCLTNILIDMIGTVLLLWLCFLRSMCVIKTSFVSWNHPFRLKSSYPTFVICLCFWLSVV